MILKKRLNKINGYWKKINWIISGLDNKKRG